MIDAPLAAAFTAGMVATVNPCGFAMLPAYLGYFLGIDQGDDAQSSASLARALLVGTVVSAGFLLLFAIAGALVSWTSLAIGTWSPWLTVIIGVALLVMGIAFVAGWEPALALPRLDKGGRSRGLWSMFVFGISYAVASLSCTIGPFTAVVATTFSRSSVAAGIATFVAYGLGMALLLMVLTVSLALARQGVLIRLRRALPFFTRIAGAIMVIAGAYLAWYGVYEIRLIQRGEQDATRGPVGLVTNWSSDVSSWLGHFDPLEVALVLALLIGGAVLFALLRTPARARRTDDDAEAGTSSSSPSEHAPH
ncbi:cytochrome c biogenesis CcdA family protein [Aquihabitans sp. McL0605]|uniref:cytochrome c biogenesis CcdA family protein n=1 Tax=Aquihabitans sp. McL0605 TaxID=3415671 RepID=UPI003CECF0E8